MSPLFSKSAWIACFGVLILCFAGGVHFAPNELPRLVRGSAEGQTIYHFAAADCRCSERLLEHLLDRTPREDAHEIVVYFGERKPIHDELELSGYELRFEASPAASGVAAAPWLLIRDSAGKVSYSGGYEPAPYWEARILFQVEYRVLRAALPAMGCVAST